MVNWDALYKIWGSVINYTSDDVHRIPDDKLKYECMQELDDLRGEAREAFGGSGQSGFLKLAVPSIRRKYSGDCGAIEMQLKYSFTVKEGEMMAAITNTKSGNIYVLSQFHEFFEADLTGGYNGYKTGTQWIEYLKTLV